MRLRAPRRSCKQPPAARDGLPGPAPSLAKIASPKLLLADRAGCGQDLVYQLLQDRAGVFTGIQHLRQEAR
jgi:hypothetical protein